MFNEEQRKAIHWDKGPLLVLGTPGSGKTTVIVNRIQTLVQKYHVNPKNILVITFTRAAADSMRERYLELNKEETCKVRFGTFHSLFYWIVRTAYPMGENAVLSEEEKYTMIRTILKELNPEYMLRNELPESILNQLGLISCNMMNIEKYTSKDLSSDEFRRIAARYQEMKRSVGKLDFDDMETMCYELLSSRPDIVESLQRLYPYIMIDEFQDTNTIQYEILKLLVHPIDNVFAVGDDDQSIYSFRGARPEIMLQFTKEFRNAEVITLSMNYRCPGIVTGYSSRLIANNRKRYSKKLLSFRNTEEAGDILYAEPKDTGSECVMISKRLKQSAAQGIPYEHMAVLYRTNQQPRKLVGLLKREGIPFTVSDFIPDIYQHFAVRPILDYIAFALGNHSREIFLRIMNKPVRYISRSMLTDAYVDLQDLKALCRDEQKYYMLEYLDDLIDSLESIKRMTPFAAVNYIRKGIGYEDYLKGYSVEHHIDYSELKDVLDEFMNQLEGEKTFDDFYQNMEESKELLREQERYRKQNNTMPGVRLMTLHSAKGLEFDEVHILDCVEEVVPHKKALKDPDGLEEERRMFYVGMTRTEKNLYLYAPQQIGGKKTVVSRFIREQLDKK